MLVTLALGVTAPAASALLELSATDKALLLTRISDPVNDIITPVNGMLAYDSGDDELQAYIGGSWLDVMGFRTSNAFTPNADGETYLEIDEDQIVIQAGSNVAGRIPTNTDVAIPLLRQKDITLVEPDQIRTVNTGVPMFAIDDYNYPQGIQVTAVKLITSATSTYQIDLEEWTDPDVTAGTETTIVNITTTASREVESTTLIDATIGAGNYIVLELNDTNDVDWVKMTVWYYPID